MNLKPYPEYKKTELPWLQGLPKNWDVLRAKSVFKPIDVRSETGAEELLSVSEKYGVSPRGKTNVTMFQAESYEGHKLCWPGDLVINSLWAWMQGLGFSDRHGIVSTAYGVYRPKASHKEVYRYFDYLLRSAAYLWELRVRSKGIYRSRYQLTNDAFFTMPIILPPKEEQHKIVRFLDAKTRLMRRFIRNKQRRIELLQEQKQAIINRAVTRGINPNVRLKTSGIDWLEDIPEHWEVLPIKRMFTSMLYGTSESSGDEGDYHVLTMGHIQNGKVHTHNCGRLNNIPKQLVLEKHDLLFNRTNSKELVGKVGLFTGSRNDCITFASYLVRMRVNEKVLPHYANCLLNSVSFLSFARQHAIPSLHQSTLNSTRYGRFRVGLPAKEEQEIILEHIRSKTLAIDEALSRIHCQIDLIREYCTRLIADVVTGKVDVRDIPVEALEDWEELEKSTGHAEVGEQEIGQRRGR